MTNGFAPQQNNGAQYPPQQMYAQPPTQQPPQFGGQPVGANFNPTQQGMQPQYDPSYFGQQQQAAPAQMPQQYQPPAALEQTEDTESYFGGGAAWISWDSDKGYRDGTPRGGLIIAKRIVPQTDIDTGEVRFQKKGDPTKPLTMLVLTLQTAERTDPEDDGRREMPVRSGLRASAKKSFDAVGAKDLEIGGWFYAARVRKEPIPNSTFKRNVFESVYARPGSPDPMAGQPAYQAPAPPPVQPQQPSAVGQFAAAYAPQAAQNAAAGWQPQPGPIANAPAQQMASFQQAGQFDPAVQAAAGGQFGPGTPPGGFAPQQPAQPQDFMPGAQQPAPAPQPQQASPSGQPGGWSPFSADPTGAPQMPPGQWSPSS